MKIIIIGGVAGGASAATRARRLSEHAEILMIERGPNISFANCGMPYYLGNEIKDRSKLLVTTPHKLKERFNIDVLTSTSVEEIMPELKKVRLMNLVTGSESIETYDKLIISPGAAPFRPTLPGIDLPGIYTLRNLQDMDQIKESLTSLTKHVTVIGGGFIGLELVENLVHLGIKTTLIEYNPQVLPPFDKEMTHEILQTLKSHQVEVILNDSAKAFSETTAGLQVHLQSKNTIETSVVIMGVGVRPENKLAVAAGLNTGPRGGIQVNQFMQTSNPDIYAAGDVVETTEFVTQTPIQIPLAGPANRQGRLAADHIFGNNIAYRGSQGTAILRVFDKTAAATGLSEKTLVRMNLPYHKIYIHPSSHAGYYPGAEQMTIKLLFAPENGKVLGAQVVGGAGVDKKIDVLAIVIQAGMTVYDLEQAELAYAPQYGSAKDGINMAGFVASNLLRGEHPQIPVEDVAALVTADKVTLIDVRTPEEYSRGHIPGAMNLPVDELRARIKDLAQDKPVITYCQVGQRGYLATRIFLQHGFDVRNISGGYRTFLQVTGT
jgi:NADPH-dependent 2,4-dienoyl-CoA reductase/sulfur reductase-like enzyme/rhodanese-related sulfurtransferase